MSEKSATRLNTFLRSREWKGLLSKERPLFSFRSDVWYKGKNDVTVPDRDFSISINANDIVQIAMVVNDDWWIGRVVGQGHQCSFVPSNKKWWELFHASNSDISTYDALTRGVLDDNETVATMTEAFGSVDDEEDEGDDGEEVELEMFQKDKGSVKEASLRKVFNKTKTSNLPKNFVVFAQSWKQLIDCYDLVPNLRPITFFGPSSSSSIISNKMQRAIIAYIKMSFPDTVQFLQCEVEQYQRQSNGPLRRTRSRKKTCEPFKPETIDKIYHIANEGKMPIMYCKNDFPYFIQSSCVMPFLCLIRITYPKKVLSELIATTNDAQQIKTINQQISDTEHLNAFPDTLWNVILRRSRFDVSCYELASFIDAYIGESTLEFEVDPKLLARARSLAL
eukprot:m.138282 g.138282  ORF g.138282 m.138282 type:complete len:393 (-) comp13951_c0_seq1:65-1243(-)